MRDCISNRWSKGELQERESSTLRVQHALTLRSSRQAQTHPPDLARSAALILVRRALGLCWRAASIKTHRFTPQLLHLQFRAVFSLVLPLITAGLPIWRASTRPEEPFHRGSTLSRHIILSLASILGSVFSSAASKDNTTNTSRDAFRAGLKHISTLCLSNCDIDGTRRCSESQYQLCYGS